MRILVLGGDGYLGWPQSIYLSSRGHDVMIFDSLMRRHFDLKFGFDSLLPIATLHERVATWQEVAGRRIKFKVGDLNDYEALSGAFKELRPEAVVHFAEQRAAPFSMLDREHAQYTMSNNVLGTLNVLYAIKELAPDVLRHRLVTTYEAEAQGVDVEQIVAQLLDGVGIP